MDRAFSLYEFLSFHNSSNLNLLSDLKFGVGRSELAILIQRYTNINSDLRINV